MIYWGFTLAILIILSVFISISKSYSNRKAIVFVFGLILIYLSSFRMGLGTDYSGYLTKIYWENYTDTVSWLNEPVFSLISLLIERTRFTPLLMFLLNAILTITGILSYYCRRDNEYLVASLALFTLLPILYFNSFNLVRQFAATGLFFFSIRFVENKHFLLYLVCILFAASLHLTSLLLIPLFFVIDKSFSPKIVLLFLGCAFILASAASPLITNYAILDERFGIYLDTTNQMGTSGMIILYNILGVVLLFFRNKFTSKIDVVSYNCFFLLILFSNLSYVNYYFFRIAVYFSPVVAYILPRVISIVFGRNYSTLISWVFALLFFIPFIFHNIDNPVVVPSDILPISALWDATQYQVVYSVHP